MDVLQETLGTNKMDASALMEYFQPITTWLENQNKQSGEILGWPDFDWMPPVPQGYPEDIGKILAELLGISLCFSISYPQYTHNYLHEEIR